MRKGINQVNRVVSNLQPTSLAKSASQFSASTLIITAVQRVKGMLDQKASKMPNFSQVKLG